MVVSILGLMELGFRHNENITRCACKLVSILGLMELGFRHINHNTHRAIIDMFQSLV